METLCGPRAVLHTSTTSRLSYKSPKPYEFIKSGVMDFTEPYEFIRFGDFHGPKPSEFIRFGDLHGPKPYEFIGLLRIRPKICDSGPRSARKPDEAKPITPGAVSTNRHKPMSIDFGPASECLHHDPEL